MDILKINDIPMQDESIESYETHEYEPFTGTSLNNPGEIRINIETQDLYTHPSESYLVVEGRLTKNDDTLYANADNVALINNAIMYLFNNIKYQLSGNELESIYNPGQASTMMGLLKYPDDFSKSVGMNQLWYKDTTTTANIANNTGFNVRHSYLIESPVPKGTFSFRIPLKHIFGFCEDYDKIVYGMKHTLTLVRKSNDDAIFRDNAMAVGKIVLDKVSWFMPHVTPSDTEKYQLYKMIESKVTLPVAYRMRQCESVSVSQSTNFTWRLVAKTAPEKPRYIIIGFQTGKSGNQEENPAVFDNVSSMYPFFTHLQMRKGGCVNYDVTPHIFLILSLTFTSK